MVDDAWVPVREGEQLRAASEGTVENRAFRAALAAAMDHPDLQADLTRAEGIDPDLRQQLQERALSSAPILFSQVLDGPQGYNALVNSSPLPSRLAGNPVAGNKRLVAAALKGYLTPIIFVVGPVACVNFIAGFLGVLSTRWGWIGLCIVAGALGLILSWVAIRVFLVIHKDLDDRYDRIRDEKFNTQVQLAIGGLAGAGLLSIVPGAFLLTLSIIQAIVDAFPGIRSPGWVGPGVIFGVAGVLTGIIAWIACVAFGEEMLGERDAYRLFEGLIRKLLSALRVTGQVSLVISPFVFLLGIAEAIAAASLRHFHPPGISMSIVSGCLLFAAGLGFPPLAHQLQVVADLELRYEPSTESSQKRSQRALSAQVRWINRFADEVLVRFLRECLDVFVVEPYTSRLSVVNAQGLRETRDRAYYIETTASYQLRVMLSYMNGGSIGFSGRRGIGKTTLIRNIGVTPIPPPGDSPDSRLTPGPDETVPAGKESPIYEKMLRIDTDVPVEYSARDFVLHLFGQLCQEYLRFRGVKVSSARRKLHMPHWSSIVFVAGTLIRISGGIAAIVYRKSIAQFIDEQLFSYRYRNIVPTWMIQHRADVMLTVGWLPVIFGVMLLLSAAHNLEGRAKQVFADRLKQRRRHDNVSAAREHLAKIRLLQTYTTGWSGGITTPFAGHGQVSRTLAAAEQPLTYPEIAASFRHFLEAVAEEINKEGAAVYISIDELDKIASGDRARQFINDAKVVFDVDGVYYFISVSTDAMVAFESRGMPLRDAFDSAFDEVIMLDYLDFAAALRLLRARVVGMSQSFVAFCYCLSGGVPRDLIRIARLVISSSDDSHDDLPTISRRVLQQEFAQKASAVRTIVMHIDSEPAVSDLIVLLERSTGEEEPTADGLLASARSIATCGDPSSHRPEADGDWATFARLRLELAAHAYFCATLLAFFGSPVSRQAMITATAPRGNLSFDALAHARQAFAVNPRLAWVTINRFREAWKLPTLAEPESVSGRNATT